VARWLKMIFPGMALVCCPEILNRSSSSDLGTDAPHSGVLKLDPWLSPFQDALKRRFSKAQEWIKRIDETEGGLDKFSKV